MPAGAATLMPVSVPPGCCTGTRSPTCPRASSGGSLPCSCCKDVPAGPGLRDGAGGSRHPGAVTRGPCLVSERAPAGWAPLRQPRCPVSEHVGLTQASACPARACGPPLMGSQHLLRGSSPEGQELPTRGAVSAPGACPAPGAVVRRLLVAAPYPQAASTPTRAPHPRGSQARPGSSGLESPWHAAGAASPCLRGPERVAGAKSSRRGGRSPAGSSTPTRSTASAPTPSRTCRTCRCSRSTTTRSRRWPRAPSPPCAPSRPCERVQRARACGEGVPPGSPPSYGAGSIPGVRGAG